jgi:crotonobetainyl-CoA:carnitine CoA-transferase CaiB-like acyl-CoA transferase
MALLDTQVAVIANLGANYLVSGQHEGKVPQRAGNAHQNLVPYQVFEVAPTAEGDKQHIVLAIGNDKQFAKFCEVANCTQLSHDARFATNAQRVRHRQELIPLLEGIMRMRHKQDWLAALEAVHVPCGAINDLAEVFADPQVASRDMVNTWQHPKADKVQLVASPMKLSKTPVRQDLPPPLLGQHTDEVLGDLIGLDANALAALRNNKII